MGSLRLLAQGERPGSARNSGFLHNLGTQPPPYLARGGVPLFQSLRGPPCAHDARGNRRTSPEAGGTTAPSSTCRSFTPI